MLKSTNSFISEMMNEIMGNSAAFAMLNRYLDTIEGVNPYYFSYDIEYIVRLVAMGEDELKSYKDRHISKSRYMQLYNVAMGIRKELRNGKSNLTNWMYDETL